MAKKGYLGREHKVKEARRREAQELDLASKYGEKPLELAELRKLLDDLPNLETLKLSNNGLTEAPDKIFQLTRLKTLDLSNNMLTTLPPQISNLSELETLSLSSNQLTELPRELERLSSLKTLYLNDNKLTEVPESIGNLGQLEAFTVRNNLLSQLPSSLGNLLFLRDLRLSGNVLKTLPPELSKLQALDLLEIGEIALKELPEWIGNFTTLRQLYLGIGGDPSYPVRILGESNLFTSFSSCLRPLKKLEVLWANGCGLKSLPEWLGELTALDSLELNSNALTDVPGSIGKLRQLRTLGLANNPLGPELRAAYEEGREAVQRYLLAKSETQIELNEAKLILIGEGEVGKSCLLGALRGDPWEADRPTTHGIEIKPVTVTYPRTGVQIRLNGWDFGGQRVYRPTHQLFFSAPAVYLVVWKPREGPQQGFVKEWIKLVKHREPDAKVLVVATHGGPKERQPDIDRQEIWDLFGKEMVLNFFLVESKPDERTNERNGITELRDAIADVAASLPEMGRTVPKRWEVARQSLKGAGTAYLPLEDVFELCRASKMGGDEAKDFIRISHRLGHLIHYEHDPALRDIVVLKPDWLSTAISFVLDDKQTRDAHGLVEFSRLGQLWNDPARPLEARYDPKLHPLFLRLMERFDLSYKVAVPSEPEDAIGFWQRVGKRFGDAKTTEGNKPKLQYTSLIAQLVPDVRPDPIPGWPTDPETGDEQQAQICRIVETKSGQSAAAEGLFFQLIVRLHKYSLGRISYKDSIHWQRGLVLEDDYGARALLEHAGNDVRISVRSPYPERFLAALTYEVKWLVENFWAGLQCDVMVPCLNENPCIGLFEVSKLIENKRRDRPEQPCPVCNEWQNIEVLLHNAPAAQPSPLEELLANSAEVTRLLSDVRVRLSGQQAEIMGRFDKLDASSRELVSKVDAAYMGLMRTLTDEAKGGPRLFSFAPTDASFFSKPNWTTQRFRLTLWCEHSRLPLPALYGKNNKHGVYDLNLPRDWVVKAAPFLKLLIGTLALVLPVASAATKLVLDEKAFKSIERQLDMGHKTLDSVLKGSEKIGAWLGDGDAPDLQRGESIRAEGAVLRQLHAWLKENDASFGGLVRVQNKRQEFLWVHPQFESEY